MKRQKTILSNMLQLLAVLFLPYIIYFFLEFYTHDPWLMQAMPQIVNYLLFFFAELLLIAISKSILLSSLIMIAISLVAGIANYFVMAFRNNPILPWDFSSIGIAMTVMDNYAWKINYRFVTSTLILLILAVLLIIICKVKKSSFLFIKKLLEKAVSKLGYRLLIICVSLLMLTGISSMLMNDAISKNFLTPTNLFTQWASYRDNGFMASFIQNLQYMRIKKPSGYSKSTLDAEVQAFLDSYKEEHPDSALLAAPAETEKPPHIIVLMNESFSDLSVLHGFQTDQDYMPFIHSLMQEDSDSVVTGNLFVSVCGGNTANSEFEFLTGNSMAFLPSGSVAYQQYISGPINSLAAERLSEGYMTFGLHPYNASGWNRNKVYPDLGLKQTVFKPDFKGAKILRKYVSDETAYNKIYELYQKNHGTAPLFFFEVTMQNHGGYTEIFDNCPIGVHLEGFKPSTSVSATENYLTLIRKSDQALEELVHKYEQEDEPVIILMFGDHQPNDYVAEKIAALTGVKKDDRELEELQNRYVVPYVIWSNKALDKEAAGLVNLSQDLPLAQNTPLVSRNTLSCNYLGISLMRLAGCKTNAYEDFLLLLKETLPVITATVAIDRDGNYMSIEKAKEQYPELFKLYQKLQYRAVFDH